VAELTILLPVGPDPRSHFLAALRSLMSDLPSRDARLLVVFDGTQPSSQEMRLLEILRAKVEILAKRRNLGQVLSAGLRLVDTCWTSRFDSDDLWPRGRLSSQLGFMKANPACVLAGSDATTVDSKGRPLGRLNGGRGRDLRRSLLVRNQLIHPTTVFSTQRARDAGGYPDVDRVEDYAFWLRLAQLGQVMNSPERWVTYRVHSGQLSRQPISRLGSRLIRTRRAELAQHLGVGSIYPPIAHLAWSAAQVSGRHGFQHLWSRFESEPAL
jgi:Glycosyl transferase family 2